VFRPVEIYKIALHDFREVGSTAVIIFEDYLIFLKLIVTSEKDPEI
jgi:hypothetical protein